MGSSSLCALPTCGAPRTLTLASNRTAAAAQVEQLCLRAELMMSVRAYVHHFEAYGLGSDELAQAVEDMRYVVDDYQELDGTL
mmetsp:Transcript_100610/g.138768  ORF Transcript_100610/g.138768 Transcript_100610/m.138768 type:complete len:83 (+) Transcript_100610:1-249(+)